MGNEGNMRAFVIGIVSRYIGCGCAFLKSTAIVYRQNLQNQVLRYIEIENSFCFFKQGEGLCEEEFTRDLHEGQSVPGLDLRDRWIRPL